jgi:hypothetical protein
MVTVLECVGGWLVLYSPAGGCVSAVTLPQSSPSSAWWMVPGWAPDMILPMVPKRRGS